ncbi:MAG: Holliday junction helicase subunit RuvA [Candidatus Parcubacteria bacterium]|jgi:Holliday junction DNA helicase RuvA
MIVTLTGTAAHKDSHRAIIEVGGLGYEVHMNPSTLAAVKVGTEVRVWIHDNVREDAHDLYGFATQPEHALFLKLINISGVGPKMAQNILSLGPVAKIEQMIEKADVDWLTSIPGVGKKTAQKIVLELKGKLAIAEEGGESDEVVSALVGLGYSRDRAREVVGATAGATVEERLRSAIKQLGR